MYIFYDLETAGLDSEFGQILQVGLVITDDDLNIVEEKSLRCRRQPWVVPSPEALLITGITPEQLEDEETTLFEMIREVEGLMRSYDWPITTAGYNSMNFDERGLRSAFHQTLLDPSLTFQCEDENTPRNKRVDVMRLVQTCLVYDPDALVTEQKTRQKTPHPAISLGVIARQNGIEFSEEEAHEAVADVKATIEVAKIIRDKSPKIWAQMLEMSTEEGVRGFLDQHDAVSYSMGYAGNMKHFTVAPVAVNANYDKQQILFDLTHDPANYLDKSVAELTEMLKKKTGKKDKDQPNPFSKALIQKQPIFMPLDQTAESLYPDGISEAMLQKRGALIKDNLEFQAKVAQAAALAEEEIPVQDFIEKQLYIDLSDDIEEKLGQWCEEFHSGNWQQRSDLIQAFPLRFVEELKEEPTLGRFPEFGKRIILDNAPEEFSSAQERYEFKSMVYARMTDPDAPAKMMTLPRARVAIEKIRQDIADGKSKFLSAGEEHKLDALSAYYDQLEEKYAPQPSRHIQRKPPSGPGR